MNLTVMLQEYLMKSIIIPEDHPRIIPDSFATSYSKNYSGIMYACLINISINFIA